MPKASAAGPAQPPETAPSIKELKSQLKQLSNEISQPQQTILNIMAREGETPSSEAYTSACDQYETKKREAGKIIVSIVKQTLARGESLTTREVISPPFPPNIALELPGDVAGSIARYMIADTKTFKNERDVGNVLKLTDILNHSSFEHTLLELDKHRYFWIKTALEKRASYQAIPESTTQALYKETLQRYVSNLKNLNQAKMVLNEIEKRIFEYENYNGHSSTNRERTQLLLLKVSQRLTELTINQYEHAIQALEERPRALAPYKITITVEDIDALLSTDQTPAKEFKAFWRLLLIGTKVISSEAHFEFIGVQIKFDLAAAERIYQVEKKHDQGRICLLLVAMVAVSEHLSDDEKQVFLSSKFDDVLCYQGDDFMRILRFISPVVINNLEPTKMSICKPELAHQFPMTLLYRCLSGQAQDYVLYPSAGLKRKVAALIEILESTNLKETVSQLIERFKPDATSHKTGLLGSVDNSFSVAKIRIIEAKMKKIEAHIGHM